jgi:Undecaprenyl-phosphate glucose phosphotransferase
MAGARMLFAGAPEFDAAVITWCLRVASLSCAAHLVWFIMVQRLRRRGLLTPNLVIVGATPSAERLVRAALAHREVHILGVFDDRKSRAPRELFGVPTLGSTADLVGHRILPYVDRIILAVPSNATGRISDLLDRLAPIPNPISLLMDTPEAAAGVDRAASTEMLLDMPLADLSGVQADWLKAAIKRTMDISLASLALLALAPVFLVIAVAVGLDSPGPIFFRQRRHGLLNEEVVVWKFRTMRVEDQDATARRQVSADDDRVTRVGRLLRRTSLDELPQLWNVVAGEMSLVGPRPHAIGMLTGGEDSSRLVQTYAHRHRMKPGLTGWAAVNGSRGPVDTPEAVRRRVALDIEYIQRQSLWLDLAIILRTLPCLLGDTDAVR